MWKLPYRMSRRKSISILIIILLTIMITFICHLVFQRSDHYIWFFPDSRPIEMFVHPLIRFEHKEKPVYDRQILLDRMKLVMQKSSIQFKLEQMGKFDSSRGSNRSANQPFVEIVTSETLRESKLRAVPLQNRQAFAKLYGYSTYFNFINHVPENRIRAWNKVLLLYALIYSYQNNPDVHNTPEWIWMLDYDILIMNFQKGLDEHIFEGVSRDRKSRDDSLDTCDLILTQDCLGINTGSFLIRVHSPWVLDFLRLWWLTYDYRVPDIGKFWEQASLKHLLKYPNTSSFIIPRTAFVEQRLFNAYPHSNCGHRYEDGDFLVHFAGHHNMDAFVENHKIPGHSY